LGFFTAFVETIKFLLIRPAQVFSVMNRTRGIGGALVFAVAIQVFTTVWRYAMADAMGDPIPIIPSQLKEMLGTEIDIERLAILLFPLWLILFHFIKAYALRLALNMRGLTDYSYQLIFRFLCYGAGTASILLLLPVVGGAASLFMSFYLAYVALRTFYSMNVGSFLATILISFMIAMGLLIGLMLVIGALELIVFSIL